MQIRELCLQKKYFLDNASAITVISGKKIFIYLGNNEES